jgi:hypothetical protein
VANSLGRPKARAIAAAQANSAVAARIEAPLVLAAVLLKASIVEAVQLALRVNVDKQAVEVAEVDRVAAEGVGRV